MRWTVASNTLTSQGTQSHASAGTLVAPSRSQPSSLVVRPLGHARRASPGYHSIMHSTATQQGEQIMSPTLEVSCRVDYRPVHATHFCEYSGRIEYLSASGCTIQATDRPDPGTTLELRLYVPGSAWPIRVARATVAWAHWDE